MMKKTRFGPRRYTLPLLPLDLEQLTWVDGWRPGATAWRNSRLCRRVSTGKFYLTIQDYDTTRQDVLREEITVHDSLEAAKAYDVATPNLGPRARRR